MISTTNPRVSVPLSITDVAEARLQASPYPSIRKIHCECDEGLLVLQGRLPTFFHKQVAQAALADILGVRQIVNKIEVLDQTT